ncbi:MAG: LLM class flavin-dependent oxidoreductase, partial [Acidimicrobiia bacterium]|nr:LLM class flavin-dependent oxidoreductase [Acidimicrobiia bacterium]
SAWDHIYEAPNEGGITPHYEAVATLAALACDTTNARLGCLVFYVGYRNPGLLAKAAVTIDHLSNGRFELGLGGGWHEWEAEAYGYDFPGVGVRLDMLAEAVELISALNNTGTSADSSNGPATGQPDDGEPPRVTYKGKHFRLEAASFLPPATYGSLPIWIGGIGRNRTLPIAAKWADGWNAAYISPEAFADLNRHLDRLCEDNGRDPGEIERSINVLFGMGLDAADAKAAETRILDGWGAMTERVRGGALLGTPEQVVEHLQAYREAGADMINIALRVPFDQEVLEAYRDVVMPAVRSADG